MRDYLKEHKFKNVFPQNPTQTADLRFLRAPQSDIQSNFTKSMQRVQKARKNLRTRYTDILDEVRDVLNGV